MGKIALIALAAGCLSLVIVSAIKTEQSESLLSHWSAYKAEFGKRYASAAEEAKRFEIFAKNKLEIDRFNAEESERAGYTQGLSGLSDKTFEEIHGFASNSNNEFDLFESGAHTADIGGDFLRELLGDDSEQIPWEVDWRKEGRVSSVKNQNGCYIWWSFVAAGLLEGQERTVKNINKTIDLSAQQLLDCYPEATCYRRPRFIDTIQFLIEGAGLMSEEDYPYDFWHPKKQDACFYDETKVVIQPKNFTILPMNDETILQRVVAKYGPVAVALDTVEDSFTKYKSGVYSDPLCGFIIGGYALLVGYGSDPVQGDYWIIKSHWGKDWGEDGYMRLRMHVGMCRIAYQPLIVSF